jgi:hypothetical protein
VLLANADKKDPKALAEQADELWGMHDYFGTLAPVVAELGEEPVLPAVRRDNVGRGGRGGGGRRGHGNGSYRQPTEPDV